MLPLSLKHTPTVTADVKVNTTRKQSLLLINGCIAFYCPLDAVLSIGGQDLVCPTCVSRSSPIFSPNGTASFSCDIRSAVRKTEALPSPPPLPISTSAAYAPVPAEADKPR